MTATSVTFGARSYTVAVMEETVRRTIYRVTCNGAPPRAWKIGEVRVGAESVFACITCRCTDCVHVEIVQRMVAAQPLGIVS